MKRRRATLSLLLAPALILGVCVLLVGGKVTEEEFTPLYRGYKAYEDVLRPFGLVKSANLIWLSLAGITYFSSFAGFLYMFLFQKPNPRKGILFLIPQLPGITMAFAATVIAIRAMITS
jgi:hypothetical protein